MGVSQAISTSCPRQSRSVQLWPAESTSVTFCRVLTGFPLAHRHGNFEKRSSRGETGGDRGRAPPSGSPSRRRLCWLPRWKPVCHPKERASCPACPAPDGPPSSAPYGRAMYSSSGSSTASAEEPRNTVQDPSARGVGLRVAVRETRWARRWRPRLRRCREWCRSGGRSVRRHPGDRAGRQDSGQPARSRPPPTCAARQARAAMLELMLPEYCPGGVEHAGLPRSGQVQPERPRGADPEATPWCHLPGRKRIVRSGVAQVLSVIVMLIQSVSSARRKSLCVIGLRRLGLAPGPALP